MTTTILTDEHIFAVAAETDIASIDPKIDVLMFSRDEMLQAGRAIEQAVLQSNHVRSMECMAETMDMVRHELVAAGVINHCVAPMFVSNAVLAKIQGLRSAIKEAIIILERDGDEWGVCDRLRAAMEKQL